MTHKTEADQARAEMISTLMLHEHIDASLAVASLLISTGIAIGMAWRS